MGKASCTAKRITAFIFLSAALFFLAGCGGNADGSSISLIQTAKGIEEAINKSDKKLAVFDLYADWCVPCRMLAPTLDKIASENAGKVTFYRINVDQVPEAMQEFHANAIPFVVFVKNRNVVTDITGLQEAEYYDKVIEENR
jgi:thioredoxin 1